MGTTLISKPTLTAFLDQLYSAAALKKLYTCYLQHFFDETHFTVKGKFSPSKIRKAQLVEALATVYLDKRLFLKLLTYFPDPVVKIMAMLVWEGGKYNLEECEKVFRTKILQPTTGRYYGRADDRVDPQYLVFHFAQHFGSRFYYEDSQYLIYLDDQLRTLFKQYLPPPPGYNITALDTTEKTQSVFKDNNRIVSMLQLICSYIKQDNLKYAKNSGKVLVTSLRQMNKNCDIVEFYENSDKALQLVRTQLMADFLLADRLTRPQNTPKYLKQLFTDYFSFKAFKTYESMNILGFLKGVSSYFADDSYEKNVRQSVFDILKSLPAGRWVSIQNIIQFAWFRELDFEIIDKHYAANRVYYTNPYDSKHNTYYHYRGYERRFVSQNLYKNIIIIPYIKGIMFLMAAFGILDIAYDTPENKHYREKDHPYLSVYDGLRYIRLTQLGAYVTGQTQTCQVTVEQHEARMHLDDKRLLITLEGSDPLKTIVLDQIGEKINESCYKVTFQSFLKGCSHKSHIKHKIKLFKSEIASDPPHVWKTFLSDMIKKTDPILPEPGLQVFKLQPDKELMSLIAGDPFLKKYILKGEGYHIIIASGNISRVKKRLETFGYFIQAL